MHCDLHCHHDERSDEERQRVRRSSLCLPFGEEVGSSDIKEGAAGQCQQDSERSGGDVLEREVADRTAIGVTEARPAVIHAARAPETREWYRADIAAMPTGSL